MLNGQSYKALITMVIRLVPNHVDAKYSYGSVYLPKKKNLNPLSIFLIGNPEHQ